MSTLRLVSIAISIAACAPRPPAPVPTVVEDAAVTDAPIEDGAAAPIDAVAPAPEADAAASTSQGCPSSFAAAQSATCILAQPAKPACEYAEATCSCTPPPQCGGAYMPHPPGSPGGYACNPKSPNVLRIDGCPFYAPKNGAACTGSLKCTYGACFWMQTIANCKGSAWSVVVHQSPPPP